MSNIITRRQFIKNATILAAAATLPACAKDPATDEALQLKPKPEIIAMPEEIAHPLPLAERDENAIYIRYAVALDDKGEPVLKDGKPVVLRDADNNPLIDGYTTPKVKLQGDEDPRTYEILFETPVTMDDIKKGSRNVKVAMDPRLASPLALTTKNDVLEYRKIILLAKAVNQQLAQQKSAKMPTDTPSSYKIDVKAVEASIKRFTILSGKPSSQIKPQP